MTLEAWALFAVTEAALSLTPGPAVLLVLSASLTRGWWSGIHASAGILAANVFYFALSATGLGALLLASWELFALVKWAGAAYLIWLGVRTFTARRREAAPTLAPRPGGRMFAHGAVAQAANPKALLFFTALLPQFVDPGAPLAPQIALLGLTSVAIEFLILAGYAGVASRGRGLAGHPRLAGIIERVGGALLIGAGAGLATLRRD